MQKIFEEEQAKLPEHLRGRFRFGVQYEEIKDLGPKVKRLFSFSSATQKEVYDTHSFLSPIEMTSFLLLIEASKEVSRFLLNF